MSSLSITGASAHVVHLSLWNTIMESQNKIRGTTILRKRVAIRGTEIHLGQLKPRGTGNLIEIEETKVIIHVPYKIDTPDDQILTPERSQGRTTLLTEEKVKRESDQDTWSNLEWSNLEWSHIRETQTDGGKWIWEMWVILIWGTEKEALSTNGRKRDHKGIMRGRQDKRRFTKELRIAGIETLMLALSLEWISLNRRPSRSKWTWVAPSGKAGIVSLSYHIWLESKVHASFPVHCRQTVKTEERQSTDREKTRRFKENVGWHPEKPADEPFCVSHHVHGYWRTYQRMVTSGWADYALIKFHNFCSRFPRYPVWFSEEL